MKPRSLAVLTIGLTVTSLTVSACLARPGGAPASAVIGVVTQVTAVDAVESSGAVQAEQMTSLFWETTGTVAAVSVQIGSRVAQGDVLMRLDPDSAPQAVLQARADLISAQAALDDLLNPDALTIANAEKAVADARENLDQAERDLRRLNRPDVIYYQDKLAEAELAYVQAQQNAEITDIGDLTRAVDNARRALEDATSVVNDARAAQAECPGCERVWAGGRPMKLEDAERDYQNAVNSLRVAELRLEQAQANNSTSLQNAADGLATARANLAAVQAGPDSIDLARAQAAVKVAEAQLADARTKLDRLINGADPDEVAVAEVRVQIAQANLDKLSLRAPFDGEVLAINVQPGDSVSPSTAAIVLANRARLHVDVPIDEIDIGRIAVGDPASLSFDSLPGLALAGAVALINPVGESVQGLVRYTVRVELNEADARVLLGMTANTEIVTDVQEGALAVPLDAVQLDDGGEFVNRLGADGAVERVPVVSGQLLDDVVIVVGDLRPGDSVQLAAPEPSFSGGPFGGG